MNGSYFSKCLGILLFLICKLLVAQHSHYSSTEHEPIECLNATHQSEMDRSLNVRKNAIEERIRQRSNNGLLEIHLHIDTSYERRRTGGYNNNQVVINYMNTLATQIVNKFNAAAPNWDLNKELSITFFDGATPFSNGQNMLETIENYLDWLISTNFPGDDDVYILYTGQYTNAGVSYLGTLCWPGVALVGFVNSQTANESLSSHEWMGHSASAVHYDQTSNVMKSSNATFPWHNSSLTEIEDYLEQAGCVENVQAPLSIENIKVNAQCENGKRVIDWEWVGEPINGWFEVLSSFDKTEWKLIDQVEMDAEIHHYSTNIEEAQSRFAKISFECSNVSSNHSEIISIPRCQSSHWYQFESSIINPKSEILSFYDLQGKFIFNSNDVSISLLNRSIVGPVIVVDALNSRKIIHGY
ncbi:MAG: hypothetical protein IPI50_02540 [Saprospiraceae bacterium]|nr:hypothetical protein [Saprospiraceae bacterium]